VERVRLGQNARQQAIELYSWEEYTRRLEEIYLNVLGMRHPNPQKLRSPETVRN